MESGLDAAPAVPKLIEALQCRKTNTYVVTAEIIRMQAARALGEIGPAAKDAVPLLQEAALNDVVSYVRSEAAAALRKIERSEAVEIPSPMSQTSDNLNP